MCCAVMCRLCEVEFWQGAVMCRRGNVMCRIGKVVQGEGAVSQSTVLAQYCEVERRLSGVWWRAVSAKRCYVMPRQCAVGSCIGKAQ